MLIRTIIYVYVYTILDFLITYSNASIFCQPECVCLYTTVNEVVSFFKYDGNSYSKVQSCPSYENREYDWHGAMQLCFRNGGEPGSRNKEKESLNLPENETFWIEHYLTRPDYMNTSDRTFTNASVIVGRTLHMGT